MTTDTKLDIDYTQLKQRLKSDDAAAAREAERTAIDLAGQGSVEAAEALAGVYSEGSAVIARDRIQEFRYTRRAADLGSAFSRAWLAHIQRESGDFGGALESARLAHEMGVEFGTNVLAGMMLAGEGQPANPLEALQLLSESVAGGTNIDGAMMLARAYLEGRYFAANPQKAYDTLQPFDPVMSSMIRRTDAAQYGDYLYLKARAIAEGARPAGDDTADALFACAVEFGHEGAADVRRRETLSGLQRAWDEIARFRAFGGNWKMFIGTCRLASSELAIDRRVLFLVSRDGSRCRMEASPLARPAVGRDYVVVFIGPQAQDVGVPCMMIDPANGKVCKGRGDTLTRAYKGNTSYLALLPCLALWGLALLCLSSGGLFGVLCAAASAFAAVMAWKAFTGGYKRALGAAIDFLRRHGGAFA
ncbi:tetratricopeptide repeat protein [uncultured Massilia sp.]|uniref:tetratricopeptide repeat protein n=1 Tax=uncultured Massilia sp. TaxID=169973 RepID=UPI0025E65ABD|nr:hypothetical protein [uncultured Massilia sp.]